MKKEISVFFPVYNDWGTIPGMVISVIDLLKKLDYEYELILVDDGSYKKTKRILKIIEDKFEKVKIIHHKKNYGYGAALRTGFANCNYDFIFYTDGDAQYDVNDLTKLLPFMKDDIDVVNGFKKFRHDPFYRILIGEIYHHFTKFIFGLPLRDIDCDFRLIRKSTLEKINLDMDSGVICIELIKKLSLVGAKFAEVEISHFFRHSGRSQFFKPFRIARTIKSIFSLWFELGGIRLLKL